MLPSVETYTKHSARMAILSIFIPSALLCWSLARNVVDISLTELLFGLGAISFSIAFGIVRDNRGFWAYVLCSVRVYNGKSRRKTFVNVSLPWFIAACFLKPICGGALLCFIVISLAALAYLFIPALIYPFIYMMGIIILPVMAYFFLTKTQLCNLNNVFNILLNRTSKEKKQRRIYYYLITDLILSLLINFALVLPIARKSDFSLSQGYEHPHFMVSFAILLVIVAIFMFYFALPPKRYAFAGELLLGSIGNNFAAKKSWVGRLHPNIFRRYVFYFIFLCLWSPLVCLVFSRLEIATNFTMLYLIGLIPILVMYWGERYNVLFNSYHEALEIKQGLDESGIIDKVVEAYSKTV